MKNTWHPESMALAEREKRALVTVIDDHVAIVLPKSLAKTEVPEDLAALIQCITRAICTALHESKH